ncbi:hypothetical protein DXG03_001066 [Asterophora parasitica]|uniref:Uncharacterized protein n=1 Tax=Asterophora parasitica TaxID=117018 RepID=A0A9P7G9W0_9AGAR|nr:hypothetical protein DXG03_001066 [Asterophora parasitica]
MFKWAKHRASGEPLTANMSSIALPDPVEETPVKVSTYWKAEVVHANNAANSGSNKDHRSKDRTSNAPTTHSSQTITASITPRPDLARERTSSNPAKPLKGILKAPKPFTERNVNIEPEINSERGRVLIGATSTNPSSLVPPNPTGQWPSNQDIALRDLNTMPAMTEKHSSHRRTNERAENSTTGGFTTMLRSLTCDLWPASQFARQKHKIVAPPHIRQRESPSA